MQQSFTGNVDGVKLDFYRFYNKENQLQYVAAYKFGTAEEILLVLLKDANDNWGFMYKENIPAELTWSEREINRLIQINEKA